MYGLFILEGSKPFVSRDFSELHEALAEDVDPVFAEFEGKLKRDVPVMTLAHMPLEGGQSGARCHKEKMGP